ncbi:MAG: MFS transporter [Proteobacteria bacterium]|nr:MFS transporter [Pseudomonadota bacterium]
MNGLRRALLLSCLAGCGLGVSLIFTAVGPILSTIATQFGGSAKGNLIAQLMVTLPSIGVIIGGPAVGILAGRMGSRLLLFMSLAAYGLAGIGGLVISSAYPLLATRFMLGIAAAGVATGSTALIADLLTGNLRARVLGYSSAVASAGAIASIFVAGSLADMGGWHLPFVIYGIGFVLLALGLASVPATSRPRVARLNSSSRKSLFALWRIYASLVAVTVVVFMTGIQVSFLLAARDIPKPGDQAWIIACASVGATLGALAYARVRQGLGSAWTLILFVAVMGIGNLVLGSQQQPYLLAFGCALNGIGGGMTVPHFASRIIEAAPEGVRPQALGFMYTMIFVGEFVNPWVVTPLHLQFGIAVAFLCIGAGALLTSGLSAARQLMWARAQE